MPDYSHIIHKSSTIWDVPNYQNIQIVPNLDNFISPSFPISYYHLLFIFLVESQEIYKRKVGKKKEKEYLVSAVYSYIMYVYIEKRSI